MAARTRLLKFNASKSVEEDNMGSFLSSSTSEPDEKRLKLPSHEHGREGSRSLSQNKTICHKEGHQEKNIAKTKSDGSSQQNQKTPRKISSAKGKKAPGLPQRSTTNSGKLPAGTPRPQRPPGRSTNTCNLSDGRQMNSASERRVLIADQSSDPTAGVGKDTEEQGPYRKGTPHPKRKRVSMCSKVLEASGDCNKINCSAGEIRDRLANKTEVIDSLETGNDDVQNSLKPNKIPLISTSNDEESSGKSKMRKRLYGGSDEERTTKSNSRKRALKHRGSDDEPLSNLKTGERSLKCINDDEETIKSKTIKRTLVYSPDTPRPPTRCSKNRPTTSSVDLQCGGDAPVHYPISIVKKDEGYGNSFAKPCAPGAPVSTRNEDSDLPVRASSLLGAGENMLTKAGCSTDSNNMISLVSREVADPLPAKPGAGEGQKSQEEKRKRKICPSPPGRETPKRLRRILRGAEDAPASPVRLRSDCSTQTSAHRPGVAQQQHQ